MLTPKPYKTIDAPKRKKRTPTRLNRLTSRQKQSSNWPLQYAPVFRPRHLLQSLAEAAAIGTSAAGGGESVPLPLLAGAGGDPPLPALLPALRGRWGDATTVFSPGVDEGQLRKSQIRIVSSCDEETIWNSSNWRRNTRPVCS